MNLVFGTAPDSWGVWFPDHASQPPWDRFLDEVAEAGYRYVELGPWGYLPTEEDRLRTELGSRGLDMIAGTLIHDLHVPDQRPFLRDRTREICGLVSALGGRFLVLIADLAVDLDGNPVGPTQLGLEDWRELIETSNELGRLVRDEFGMTLTFHPHADSVVEYAKEIDRLLDGTDSDAVQLCLDTGHVNYRDGDSVAIMRERSSRVPYLHLKNVDGDLKQKVAKEGIGFPQAVKMGVMCEPDMGVVDFAAMAQTMRDLDWEGWAIVEQDMFPLDDVSKPAPIATRTRHYFQSLGWVTNRD
jgi:inosose dehydratase